MSILLNLACADQRFVAPVAAIDHCELWADYLPTAQPGDRIVTCTSRSLALQSNEDVATVHERWTASLAAQGLTAQHLNNRSPVVASDAPMVSEVWADDEPVVALAISNNGVTHVSVAVVP